MIRLLALGLGFLLDLVLGDPSRLPHPVVAIGNGISVTERVLRRLLPSSPRGELCGGAILVLAVIGSTMGLVLALASCAAALGSWAELAFESLVCYQCLATKSLREAGLAVWKDLSAGDLPAARRAVGRIVGRDTAGLDGEAIARAGVETIAENTSDGVVAPMLYFALGGPVLALAYKAINTMDSMIGYKNGKYLFFGRTAARLDDAANWLPARLSALLMIPASRLAGLDSGGAWRVYRRDRRRHPSPNAGHPEAACAGALGIRLGGGANYGGLFVPKPSLGDGGRAAQADDIRRAARLLDWTVILALLVCSCLTALAWRLFGGDAA